MRQVALHRYMDVEGQLMQAFKKPASNMANVY